MSAIKDLLPRKRGFRADADEDDQFPASTRRIGCAATGCPMRPSCSSEGSSFVCSAHSAAPPHRWPHVTDGLQQNTGLIALITRLQSMYAEAIAPDLMYRAIHEHFEADRFMYPTAYECKHFPMYLYRLHRELLYRAGAASVRPEPREAA